MNILQVNTTDTRGGAAKVAYLLKKGLEKSGHTTSMFVGQKYSNDENVFLLNDVRSLAGKIRRKLAYWLANDIDVFNSGHILKTEQFKNADIVHCHNLHSNYFNLNTLQKISRLKPVIWTLHDMWPITAHCAHAFDGPLKENGFFTCPSLDIYPPIAWHNEKYLEKRKGGIYQNSKFNIVTPSKWLAEKVSQSALKEKMLSVIYNGVDTNTFHPLPKEQCRKELNLPLDKKIILSFIKKTDDQWKGLPFITEITERFKNNEGITFINIGRTTGNRNNLSSLPPVGNDETLSKYYSAADALLYPSIADNCPLVVLEAMACGLPVVSFDTGWVPELVEHKINGYVAEYKNSDDLKTGVEYLLNLPPQEIEKMKQYSINKIKSSFTLDLMTNKYIQLYESALAKFAAPLNEQY